MRTIKEINRLKKVIVPILKKHKVKRAGIFGSYARGEQKKNSDVDILIDFQGSLLDLIAIELEIERAVGIKADVLTYKGIYHLLRKRILSEEVRVL